MKSRDAAQRPHAFLLLADFQVLLPILGGYLQYLRQQKQESTLYQELYTKVEIAVFAISAGKRETLVLNHDELVLLWEALSVLNRALTLPIGDDALEHFRPLADEQLARIQSNLLAALFQAKGGQHMRLHD